MTAKRAAGKTDPRGDKKTPARRASPARKTTVAKTAARGKGKAKTGGRAPAKPSDRQSSPLERGIRDMRVLQLKADGLTTKEIAIRDGRTVRAISDVLNLYETRGIPDGANLLDQRPAEILRSALNRWSLAYDAYFEIALNTKGENIKLGALKQMVEIDGKRIELMQALGVIPKNLGVVRHLHDIETVARKMLEAVDAFAEGEGTAEGLRAFFYELVGLPAPSTNGSVEDVTDAA